MLRNLQYAQAEKKTLRAAARAAGLSSEDLEYIARRYDAGVEYADGLLAPLLDRLAQPDLRERTLVVVASDHGEAFGEHVAASGARFIEPPWKAVLANKGVLAYLWEMFEGHPNLLPAYFEDDPRAAEMDSDYVRKPLLSRQGSNIQIRRAGAIAVVTRCRPSSR